MSRNPYVTTLLLLVILSGLGGYVYFIEVPAEEKSVEQSLKAQKLIPFDDRDITHLTFSTPEETIVFIRNNKHRWFITDPIVTPADSGEVRKILRALTVGKIKRIISDPEGDESNYGLTPPRFSLTLTAGGHSEHLDLGDPSPLSWTLYARKSSDGRILLTTLEPATFIHKTLLTFRQKAILSFDRSLTKEVRLQIGDQPIILARRPGVHGLSPNWHLRSPLEGPADQTQVSLLLIALEDLKALDFVDSQVDKTRLLATLGPPKATVTIRSQARDHLVRFYRHGQGAPAYAQTSPEAPLYQIDPGILAKLTKDLLHFRDKRLLGMEIDDIAMLTVNTPGEAYTLINQTGQWVLEEDPGLSLNQEMIRLFMSRIVGLPAELPVTEKADQLETYGLNPPVMEVRAVDQQGRGRGYLLLGHRGRGLVYAMGAGLPGVYQARSIIIDQIPSRQSLLEDPTPN